MPPLGYLLLYFFWTLYVDVKMFAKVRRKYLLMPLVVTILFTFLSLVRKRQISSNFDKLTLLKAHYDGGTNGTSIDFKTDGTFIISNEAFDYKDYQYGSFSIENENITLSPFSIIKVLESNHFEIKEFYDGGQTGDSLYQTNDNGERVKGALFFRIVADNRKGITNRSN